MQRSEIIEYKINPALSECEAHHQRLMQAWAETREYLPAQSPTAHSTPLTDSQVRTLDQMVFRFGRLQDAIGTRLLPALLQLIGEWHEAESFIDTLNRAEKLAILPSAEAWLMLRELRNQAEHEHPDQPERLLRNLARLIEHVPVLEHAFHQIGTFAKQRIAPH
ncbi:MAG: hypothetical protein RIR70_803 [Pseudomonadota bacterium]